MTSQMNTKVRLVRCPRCRQVLPELADVPVYKCGGCGAILQAKNRKRDTQDTGSLVPDADPSQTHGLDHVITPSMNESDSDKSLERHGSGLDRRKEGLGGLNQSHERHDSDVSSCHDNTGSSPETSGHAEVEENKFPLVQYDAENQNKLGDDDSRHPQDTCAPNEILSSPEVDLHEDKSLSPRKEDENRYSSGNISDGGQNDSQISKKELPISTTFSRDISSYDESSENGNFSPASANDRYIDEDSENHSRSRSPAAVAYPDTSPEGRAHKAQSSSTESDSPDNQMFPFSDSMKQAQEETLPDFQRVSSADTLENMPQVYARNDLGVTLRSPTAKNYYAYDVNTSSCEETENQVPSQHFRSARRNFKDTESNSTRGMPKNEELMVNHRMSNETVLPPRPINFSENVSVKKHQSKGSNWNRGELHEPTRHSHPINNTIMERGEYLSRPPIYSKVSQPVRDGSSSSYDQRSLPERTVDPESDKMELLKMVYELQDQLNRAHLSKGRVHDKFSGRVAKEEELLHAHSNLFVPNKERYPEPNYPRYPERRDNDRYWSQQAPHMGFSGDANHYRNEVDCSCSRCYRQEHHYSAQMPRYAYYDERHNMAYHRHNSHSPHHSASGSPHHYIPSEFMWSRESDGKPEKSYEVNKQQQPAKQHFRPIAGGAPIIVCYCCNEILQLPADFLLFKRRCHRLRCSACTAVLKFSLEHRIHLVEYSAEPRTPPTSEVGGYTETMNLASASRASDYQHGDPVSSSDDYGQSYNRSSTDTEHFSPAPFQISNETSDRQKLSASNPFESKKDGKKIIIQDSRNTYKSSRETFELGGPSKVFEPVNVSEIEEVSEGGSPLHRLMGYPSPGRLVYRYSADV
ncbi:hypothetical protein DCAR_0626290 [Daucus carota subsp. sativus]|uniref:Uncharacterized protein n=1 Tax=Daucus carota subsp. sativus TaxID=79200 RepID=A0A161ZYV2_DAUCS|nr:PREDICTED: uncharacterized protein At5g05190-like [Daucus carota subsp. sativus]WOH06861.1 hypothetical protein DCAR_0626290 [Daucus carota subsp. sativus]